MISVLLSNADLADGEICVDNQWQSSGELEKYLELFYKLVLIRPNCCSQVVVNDHLLILTHFKDQPLPLPLSLSLPYTHAHTHIWGFCATQRVSREIPLNMKPRENTGRK